MKPPDLPLSAVPLDELGPAPPTRVTARGVARVERGVELCPRCRRAVTEPDADVCRRCESSATRRQAQRRPRSGPPSRKPSSAAAELRRERVWPGNRSPDRTGP